MMIDKHNFYIKNTILQLWNILPSKLRINLFAKGMTLQVFVESLIPYTCKTRKYHSIYHVFSVLNNLNIILPNSFNEVTPVSYTEECALYLAAFYHDVLDSEDASINHFKKFYKNIFDPPFIDMVVSLINVTKHDIVTKDCCYTDIHKAIHDADIMIFGDEPKKFINASICVIEEYYLKVKRHQLHPIQHKKEIARKRIEFMEEFIKKDPFFYHNIFDCKYGKLSGFTKRIQSNVDECSLHLESKYDL